jgi:ribosomal protein S18 acetylase RimI-like enzyme
MYDVRTATVSDLDDVIELVARLQAEPAHQIGFHGETLDEVAEELGALEPDWASGAAVAVDSNGRLRGVLSVEADPEQHRAYLYGPFVDVPAKHPAAGHLWQATADAMLDHVRRLPRMAGVVTMELFGHRENRLLADFAGRHDAPVHVATRCFMLAGDPLSRLLARCADANVDERVVPLPDDEQVRDAVARLHDRCFPDAPTTGRQLVSGDRHSVVVLLGERGLLGYAGGYAQAEEYYVDVVGVDPVARWGGVGRTLVRRLVGELADRAGARNRVAALIRHGNDASERMFTKLGFELTSELVSYQADLGAARAHRPAV